MAKPWKRTRAKWLAKGGTCWRKLRGYARYFRAFEKRVWKAREVQE